MKHADHPSTCSICNGRIERGERITQSRRGWVHVRCWSELHE